MGQLHGPWCTQPLNDFELLLRGKKKRKKRKRKKPEQISVSDKCAPIWEDRLYFGLWDIRNFSHWIHNSLQPSQTQIHYISTHKFFFESLGVEYIVFVNFFITFWEEDCKGSHDKVDIPYLDIHLNWTPIFEWYVVGWISKNGCQKNMSLKEMGLHAPNTINLLSLTMTIMGRGGEGGGPKTYDHLMSTRIFALILSKIFV